mgnify:FL=1
MPETKERPKKVVVGFSGINLKAFAFGLLQGFALGAAVICLGYFIYKLLIN